MKYFYALRKAIYVKFASSQVAGTVYAAVSGRMRFAHVPNDWTLKDDPYIVYNVVDSVPFGTFGIVTAGNARVSFTVWDGSNSATTAEDVGNKLCTLFDDCVLAYTASTLSHISVTRLNSIGPEWVQDEAGGGAWRLVIDYEVRAEE